MFLDFIQADVIQILNELQTEKTYTDDAVASYSNLLTNEVLGVYAQQAWN